MQNTLAIFEERKHELELYYSILLDIDNEKPTIRTIDNTAFFKILKSNYILMLYNLVEACIVSGLLEIYDGLKAADCTYEVVTDEIKTIWRNCKIAQIYGPSTERKTYENKVQEMIDSILANGSITLNRSALDISGNLDATRIKALCDKHGIRYRVSDDQNALLFVKDKRNGLAHGDVSFSDCARDYPLNDLYEIHERVIRFMHEILHGMNDYYIKKGYKAY